MILHKEAEAFRASDPDLLDESLERKCPFSGTGAAASSGFVPLSIRKRAHVPSEGTVAIMKTISLSELQVMTDLFYEKAFLDQTLDRFIRSHEDPHGARFAKWIHQKLSGSDAWDRDRAFRRREKHGVTLAAGADSGFDSDSEGERSGFLVHDRTTAHVAAWHSPKRPPGEVGRHFQLDECRVWMRLHFWALRESGLLEANPAFSDYYVRFIAHFVRVYENTAPAFARDSLRWSASVQNIERYIRSGRRMKDVLGLGFGAALAQLPEAEADDDEWPYHSTSEGA